MGKMNFNDKCFDLLFKIPKGKVTTYKEIARALNTKAYRAVGRAMAKNKNLIFMPCHRVVRNDGKVGGYAMGLNKKINLLQKEGIVIINGTVIDFKDKFHSFSK